jgi:hypothetical protein
MSPLRQPQEFRVAAAVAVIAFGLAVSGSGPWLASVSGSASEQAAVES